MSAPTTWCRARTTPPDRYKWTALSNTTLGVFMAALDSSIVLISLPAIFRGIHLDPLQPGNVKYLLWMLMGYLVVTAVLVVTFGRLGDMYGRVRMYNAGFLIFTIASILLSLTPFTGSQGALWLIGFRIVQGVGGALLLANSTAILTDAFPATQRGMAMGINMVAAIAGQFFGLVIGGLLADIDWRLIFWVNVPVGVFGTVWAYLKLREVGVRRQARMDWWGNVTFALGLILVLIGITYGIQPYGGHAMGWSSPSVLGELFGGVALLVIFVMIERRVAEPMFNLQLFKIRAFLAGNVANFMISIGRGGLQFMLIIWLQGIWLPLHGYNFVDTPLWAGIYMLPLTCGFLVAGPLSGWLSDRYGARLFGTAGTIVTAVSFGLLMFLPADFSFPVFGALLLLNGIGVGLFTAPNTTAIMNSVKPLRARRGLGHAGDVPEQRAGAVDRLVLLAHGRGPGVDVAGHDGRGAAGERRAVGDRDHRRAPAAGGIAVRGVPGVQPDPEAARPGDVVAPDPPAGAGAHRPLVLPEPHLGPVHRLHEDRLHRRARDVADRGGRVVEPGQGAGAQRRRQRRRRPGRCVRCTRR